MTTQLLEVTGIAQWAKVYPHNKDKNEDFHGPGGAYTIDVLLDKEELDKVTASGCRVKPRLTEEGITIKFKRKETHVGGIDALGGAPRVVDEEGNDFTNLIGNGSKVTVFASVYDTKMGKGTRLEAVQVLDLVEFETEEGTSGVKLPF